MKAKILLSFDVEEFDIPEEFGQKVAEKDKMSISREGLYAVLELLNKLNIHATFFTTANFALHHKNTLRNMAERHEIASHGYYHSSFEPKDILSSKKVLEEITSQRIEGYRMARLAPFDETLLVKAGYVYNSSLNPTLLPGRYNNLSKPRLPFYHNRLLQLPASVTPIGRIPLFWITFKNIPLPVYKYLALSTLKHDNYLNIYFHPWEFVDISRYNIPFYTKKVNGVSLLQRLEQLLVSLKEKGEFIKMKEYGRLTT